CGANPACRQGVRIGSTKDGVVRFYVPDPPATPESSFGEGVAVDAAGNLYVSEGAKKGLRRYAKQERRPYPICSALANRHPRESGDPGVERRCLWPLDARFRGHDDSKSERRERVYFPSRAPPILRRACLSAIRRRSRSLNSSSGVRPPQSKKPRP